MISATTIHHSIVHHFGILCFEDRLAVGRYVNIPWRMIACIANLFERNYRVSKALWIELFLLILSNFQRLKFFLKLDLALCTHVTIIEVTFQAWKDVAWMLTATFAQQNISLEIFKCKSRNKNNLQKILICNILATCCQQHVAKENIKYSRFLCFFIFKCQH